MSVQQGNMYTRQTAHLPSEKEKAATNVSTRSVQETEEGKMMTDRYEKMGSRQWKRYSVVSGYEMHSGI